jgi:hypothetical protein
MRSKMAGLLGSHRPWTNLPGGALTGCDERRGFMGQNAPPHHPAVTRWQGRLTGSFNEPVHLDAEFSSMVRHTYQQNEVLSCTGVVQLFQLYVGTRSRGHQ